MFNPYAAGKKVYSRGSYAPTRGRVDPQGYIKRELKKRGTMQSQNRSGLAQKALRRTLRQNIIKNQGFDRQNLNKRQSNIVGDRLQTRMRQANADGRPGNLRNPNLASDYQRILKGLKQNRQGRTDAVHRPTPPGVQQPGAQQPNQPSQPAYTPPDYVKINSNGQLDLPYDESMSWEMLNMKQGMNTQLMDILAQQQQQGLEFGQLKRQGELDYNDVQRETLTNDASRGMAFSSGYANNVANNANRFNTYMGDLEASNANFNASIAGQKNSIETAFNDFLRKSALEQAQKLQGEAGNLGYGQSQARNTYEDPGKPLNPRGKSGSPKKKAPSKPKSKQKTKKPRQRSWTKQVINRGKRHKIHSLATNRRKPRRNR